MSKARYYLSEGRPLSDAIEYFSSRGNVNDLAECLTDAKYRRSTLYVLSEIGGKARRVWKKVVPYAGDPDPLTAYWALDLIHAYLAGSDAIELLDALRAAHLENDRIFAKVALLLFGLDEAFLRELCTEAIDLMCGMHAVGIFLLSSPTMVKKNELRKLLRSSDRTLKVYLCALVGRNFLHDRELFDHLPAMVREDYLLEMNFVRSRSG